MATYTYIFSELDKRALIGALCLEILHKDLNFKVVTSNNCPLETLLIKGGGEEKKLIGFHTIIQYFNAKSQVNTDDVDFSWKISYGLTSLKSITKGKKVSTKLKLNKSILKELEAILSKQAFLTGKAVNELDIVTFVNINDPVEKKLEKYTKSHPNLVKFLAKIKAQVSTASEDYQQRFPKVKKEEKKKEEAKVPETKPAKEEAKKQEKAKPAAPVKSKAKSQIDPEVQEILNKCKINRLTKGKQILPRADKKNILITSALPYVNNVPHLGNIIGCVLSADVYARFSRLRGNNTIYICGTDEYGTATETKALQEGKTPREICDYYFQIHKESYEWFDCDFDYFGRTTTEQQTKICQDIFWKLHKNGLLTENVLKQPRCNTCDRFLADRFVHGTCPFCGSHDARGDQCDGCDKLLDPSELIDPKCEICKNTPVITDTKHLFLDLPTISARLEKWVEKSSVEGDWSHNSIQTTKTWLKQGLKPRCITRDLKWGVQVPLEGYENKVFYVWFDAPIGYISITANYLTEWEKWWKNPENVKLIQFMGKDNVPFHTVIFPSTLIGAEDNYTTLHHISTTEYLNYEAGLAFSKRRGTGVFADGARETRIPSEVWRYYLLINRPEQADTEFNWDDLAAKVNTELANNLGNLINRTVKFIYDKFEKKVPEFTSANLNERDLATVEEVFKKFQEYVALLDKVEIKFALRAAMELSSICNKYMQDEKPWDAENIKSGRSPIVLGVLANLIKFISSVFEPFMPSFSAKINYILGRTERTETDEVLYEIALKEGSSYLLKLLPPGQVLNKPVPLFEQITPEDIQEYRAKFGEKEAPKETK